MNEAQLVNRRRRQNEGIAIWPPETAVEVVQHIGEGEPRGEHVIKGVKAVIPRGGLQGRLVRPEGLQPIGLKGPTQMVELWDTLRISCFPWLALCGTKGPRRIHTPRPVS
jgi:hypothetical protein